MGYQTMVAIRKYVLNVYEKALLEKIEESQEGSLERYILLQELGFIQEEIASQELHTL